MTDSTSVIEISGQAIMIGMAGNPARTPCPEAEARDPAEPFQIRQRIEQMLYHDIPVVGNGGKVDLPVPLFKFCHVQANERDRPPARRVERQTDPEFFGSTALVKMRSLCGELLS